MSAADYVTDGWNVAPVPGPTPDTYYPPNSIPPDAVPVAAAPANAVPYTGQTPAPGQQIIYQTAPAAPPTQAAPAQAPPAPDAAQTAYVTDGWGSANGAAAQPSASPPRLKPDLGLGFEAGMYRPLDNVTGWLGNNPVGQWIDKNVGQPLGFPSTQQQIAGHQAAIDQAAMQGRTPDKWTDFLGSALASAPVMAMTGSPILAGAAMGALNTRDPNNLGTVAADAGIGAAGGKFAHMLTGTLAGAIAPKLASDARLLADEGVRLSPGQLLGPGWDRLEGAIAHIPGPGTMVNSARMTALGDANRALAQRTLTPIGQMLPTSVKPGTDAINYSAGQLGDVYKSALNGLTVPNDAPFNQRIGEVASSIGEIPGDYTPAFKALLNNYLAKPMQTFAQANPETGWALSGDALKQADSKFAQVARQYSKSTDGADQDYGRAVGQARGALHDLVGRVAPDRLPQLQAANTGWANLVRLETAANNPLAATQEGLVTGKQMLASLKANASSPRALVRNQEPMQDLATAMARVLPNKLGDSGTPLGMLVAGGLLGGGEHMDLLNAHTLGGMALAAAPYTAKGSAALRGFLTSPRPPIMQGAADALRYAKLPAVALGARSPLGLLPIMAGSMLFPHAEPANDGINDANQDASQ